MARIAKALTVRQVDAINTPGTHAVGGSPAGVSLVYASATSRSWVFRTTIKGARREFGLGSYPDISLAQARGTAAKLKESADAGEPVGKRASAKAERATVLAEKGYTFREAAAAFIESHRSGWKNAKHADQWANTLATYAFPVIGDMNVADIRTEHVLGILVPIWSTKNETATRVRSRIQNVIDAAIALDKGPPSNPAMWTGRLKALLPAPSKVAPVVHHPAMPWRQLPAYLKHLRENVSGISARCLEFAILTAARSENAREARWCEIDFERRLWTIEAPNMKRPVRHIVPLNDAAIQLLERMRVEVQKPGEFIFPSPMKRTLGRPLSNMAMLKTLRHDRSKGLIEHCTQHGFRSCLRDWSAEAGYEGVLAEFALHHALESQTEAAYFRSPLLRRRRRMMDEWSEFIDGQVTYPEEHEMVDEDEEATRRMK